MTQATVPGYVYTVYTAEGCTVTAPGFPAFLVTCTPGMANSFTAPGDKVEISDPAATLVAVRTFNGALAALGLLGGGSTLPAGYTRLEYLEGDGQAYLNIPREWKESDSFRLEYISTKDQPNENVFGAANSYRIVNGPNYTLFFVAGERNDFAKAVKGAKNEASIEARKIIFNGKEKEVAAAEWTNDAASYKIFTNNTLQYQGFFRLLSFEHRSDTVMKLVPALDSTGAPCMFDTVGRTPFYNAGTGDFVTPQAAARTYSLRGRRVLPDWGKLTETGLRRLYHVPEGYRGDALQYAAENGFCPIQEEPQPEEGWWAPKWEEVAGVIYLRWVETAPPEELATGKE